MPNRPVDDPILAYNADGEINNLQWSASQPDWVSIAFKDKLQICKFIPSNYSISSYVKQSVQRLTPIEIVSECSASVNWLTIEL